MRWTFLTLIVATPLMCAGCTTVRSHEEALVAWPESGDEFGRVAILQRVADVGDEAKRIAREDEVAMVTRKAISSLPGTSLADTEEVALAFGHRTLDDWTNQSDYELITAARQAEIDTLCLLDVQRYAGMLSIGLNPLPGWWVDTAVAYHVRILDVESGALVADTWRSRAASRSFAFAMPEEPSANFAADLHALLNPDMATE